MTPQETLKKYWGYASFRPVQAAVIDCILEGQDAMALLPTGGGKSICYQVPGVMLPGVCLVISPLIALMNDQVASLRARGISAVALHSALRQDEIGRLLREAAAGRIKFLYCSPERLESAGFLEALSHLAVNLIAVDEAHCICQWGYDFRPSYLRLPKLRDVLTGVRLVALTASATPEVTTDVMTRLGIAPGNIFRPSFARPELSYSVFKIPSRINKLLDVLSKVNGTAIVYCSGRRRTEEIASLLQMHGISSEYYHARVPQQVRDARQEGWLAGEFRVMVATNAFGMGIDKPDVRCVVHADVPDSLERYYQEAGRAGRDGRRAYAVLLADEKDIRSLDTLASRRYPPVTMIRKVYQAIADYLQLPVGTGEGSWHDFDPADMAEKFRLDSYLVTQSVKALEQSGHVSFREQVSIPARITPLLKGEAAEELSSLHPDLSITLGALLRSSGTLSGEAVAMSAESVFRKSGLTFAKTESDLNRLSALGAIEYKPASTGPQLGFLLPRAPARYISFDTRGHEGRKREFARRAAAVIDYINERSDCRSQMLSAYFGDPAVAPCGICDNCIARRKKQARPTDFETINAAITEAIKDGPVSVTDLPASLAAVPEQELWEVIAFLQDEGLLASRGGKIGKPGF